MCTYQIINILNRNATTRNLVGKLTVWLDILSQRCFRVGPSVKTVNIHVYTYIFLNKYLFDKMSTLKKCVPYKYPHFRFCNAGLISLGPGVRLRS